MPSGVYKRTPKHGAAVSKGIRNSEAVKAKNEAQRGVSLPQETCAEISEGIRNSDAVKAHNDAMRGVPHSSEQIAAAKKGLEDAGVHDKQRGGNDLVNHHYIYDHNDLSLNTVQMTRSDHARLHALLRKLGYKVPHIILKPLRF